MKVCGIIPQMPWQFDHYSDPNLGLLSVLATMRNHNINVKLFDEGHDVILPFSDAYLLSATTLDMPKIIRFAKDIKLLNPESKIIVGGPHFDVLPEQYWQKEIHNTPFDIISRGEGEANIERILKEENGKQVITQEGKLLNLDSLPLPARDLLDKDKYFTSRRTFGLDNVAQGNSSTIMTSRGCPHTCGFCASPTLHKRKVRFKSTKKVMEELELLINEYSVNQLRWQDDNIPLNFRKQKGLKDILHTTGIKSRGSARADQIYKHPEILKELWYAGFRELGFGIETADQKVLDGLCKGTTIEMNYEALRRTKEVGFVTRAFMMTGLPNEDINSADRTIEFFESLGKNKPDVVTLCNFMPLPGCDVFNNPKKYGVKILTEDWNRYNIAISRDGTPNWTHQHNNLTHEQMNTNLEKLKVYLFNNGLSNVAPYNKPYESKLLNDEK